MGPVIDDLKIFSGNAHKQLAQDVCDYLNIPLGKAEVFKFATNQALKDFKGKKIKIGRARMFEDKTKDLDDPGMFALNRLTKAF